MESVLSQVGPLNISAGALLVAVVWLILLGRLVPRKTLDDVRTDRDARLADVVQQRNDWFEAYQNSQQTNTLLTTQVTQLLELARTTDHFIRSLPRPAGSEAQA